MRRGQTPFRRSTAAASTQLEDPLRRVCRGLRTAAGAIHRMLADPPDRVFLAFSFPLFPPEASTEAPKVDILFFALIAISLFFLIFIHAMLIYFAIHYRAGSKADRTDRLKKSWKVELTWIAGATVIGLGLFIWGAKLYFDLSKPPPGAATYYVVGKQWMWEIEHPDGRREIDELHVPIGEPIRFVITSEDVIHSFFVPAFRIKQDAVPGRYTSTWVQPTRLGAYHLFCAQYCGVDHARMTGTVYVMSRPDYEMWLRGEPRAPTAQPLHPNGETTFRELGCNQCHRPDNAELAPSLEGLYGSRVQLSDGTTVIADEQYIRESILDPAAKIVAGYPAVMPTYKGLLNEEQIELLVEAVKALRADRPVKETRQ